MTKVSETEIVDVAPGTRTVNDPLIRVRRARETQPRSMAWAAGPRTEWDHHRCPAANYKGDVRARPGTARGGLLVSVSRTETGTISRLVLSA